MGTAAIAQARMSSSRLPGKVMKDVGGQPLIAYVLDRLERAETIDRVVVATSVEDSDTPIADYCAARGIECRRGSLADVAGRFVGVLDELAVADFVRVTCDAPLLDQRLVDRGVRLFRDEAPDLVTNVAPRTFPPGESVEVVSAEAMRRAYGRMRDDSEREHVTQHLYRHPDEFRIVNFENDRDDSALSLAVDTAEDLAGFEAIVAAMERPHWDYSYPEIAELKGAVGS
jgi:spore coat polysaccharide biosynthesis protein SpsF